MTDELVVSNTTILNLRQVGLMFESVECKIFFTHALDSVANTTLKACKTTNRVLMQL